MAQTSTGGVGIGTTAPDASAALDIVSSSKGVLLPRVTSAAAITTPATGLIVYQTGGTAGYYYYSGTSWQQLATASGAAITATNGLTKTGSAIGLGGTLTGSTAIGLAGNTLALTGGNVGIGTTTAPAHPLTIQADGNQYGRLLGFSDHGGTDRYNFSRVDATTNPTVPGGLNLSESNVAAGRLFVQDNTGFVGLGTLNPTGNLSITPGSTGTKLVLFDASGSFYGFGISANQTNYHVPGTAGSHVFYAGGRNGDGAELLRIAGTGRVGIGTSTPGQLLSVSGGIQATSSGAFSGTTATDQGAHLQWNRSGSEGETWLLNHLGLGGYYAGIRFGGINTSTGTTPTEWARFINNGNFGLGTTDPTARLDVNGSVRLRGLTTAGVVTTDASGNLGSSPAAAAFGSSFIQNTTSQQASSNFSISGTGLVGSSVGIGTASPSGRLTVQTAADTDLGLRLTDGASSNLVLQGLNGANSGYQYLSFNGYYANGEQRFSASKNRWRLGADQRGSTDQFFLDTYNGNTITPVLTATTGGNVGLGTSSPSQKLEVAGTVYSSSGGFKFPDGTVQTTAAAAATGSSFIQNQSGAAQAANFNINGSGTLGGGLTAQSLTVSQGVNALSAVINSSIYTGQLGVGANPPAGVAFNVNGTTTMSSTLQLGSNSATGKVLTPATGTHNMLAVAYGQVYASNSSFVTVYSTSGNYTVARTGTGSCTITFTAASGLSNYNFDAAPVVINLYRSNGFVNFDGSNGVSPVPANGVITVHTYNTSNSPADLPFSFVVFAP